MFSIIDPMTGEFSIRRLISKALIGIPLATCGLFGTAGVLDANPSAMVERIVQNPAEAPRVLRQVAVSFGGGIGNAVNGPGLSAARGILDAAGLHGAAGAVARYQANPTDTTATIAAVDRAVGNAVGH